MPTDLRRQHGSPVLRSLLCSVTTVRPSSRAVATMRIDCVMRTVAVDADLAVAVAGDAEQTVAAVAPVAGQDLHGG